MVLRVSYRNAAALLLGDSHKKIEELLEREDPGTNFLKIGHQGSLTSSTPEFLNSGAPPFAVGSAGYYRSFGHPCRT